MGSSFSSFIDRSQCSQLSVFEKEWSVPGLTAAACRAYSMLLASAEAGGRPGTSDGKDSGSPSRRGTAQGSPRRPLRAPPKVSLRRMEITRLQFHDIFADYSYILPTLEAVARLRSKLAKKKKKKAAAAKAGGGGIASVGDASELGLDSPTSKPRVSTASSGRRSEAADTEDEAWGASDDSDSDLDDGEEMDKVEEAEIHKMLQSFRGLKDEVFDMFLPTSAVPKATPLPFSDGSGGAGGSGAAPPPTAAASRTQTIRAADVFVAIALMCRGTVMHRLAFLYHFFSDDFVWDARRTHKSRWVVTADSYELVDRLDTQITVHEMQDIIFTVGTTMRRIGVSVADIPFSRMDPDAAALTLPKSASIISATTAKGLVRPAHVKLRAAVNTVRHAIKAGILEQLTGQSDEEGSADEGKEGDAGEAATSSRPGTSTGRSAHLLKSVSFTSFANVVPAMQAVTEKEKMHAVGALKTTSRGSPRAAGEGGGAAAAAAAAAEAAASASGAPAGGAGAAGVPPLRRGVSFINRRAGEKGAGLHEIDIDDWNPRQTRIRRLAAPALDDDAVSNTALIMMRRVTVIEELAVTPLSAGWTPPGKNRFRIASAQKLLQMVDIYAALSKGSGGGGGNYKRRGSVGSTGGGDDSAAGAGMAAGRALGSPAAGGAASSNRRGSVGGGLGSPAGAAAGNTADAPVSAMTVANELAAASDSYSPNDSEWALGLAATAAEPWERWRRLPPSRKKAYASIPSGRNLKAQQVCWDFYVNGDYAAFKNGSELAAEVNEARKTFALAKVDYASVDALPPLRASSPLSPRAGGSAADAGFPASPAGRGRSATLSLPGPSGSGASPSPSGRDPSNGPPPANNRMSLAITRSGAGAGGAAGGVGALAAIEGLTVSSPPAAPVRRGSNAGAGPNALASMWDEIATNPVLRSAREAMHRYDALLATYVDPRTFFDWCVTHPVPRYIMRQLCYPLGKIGTYDGLDMDIPLADARNRVARGGGRNADGTALDPEKELARIVKQTTLTIPDLRQFRLVLFDSGVGGQITFEQFKLATVDFLDQLVSERKERLQKLRERVYLMTAEQQQSGKPPSEEMLAELASIHASMARIVIPPWGGLSEGARKRLVQRFFACFDPEEKDVIGVSEFSVGLSRYIHGSPTDKLALLFDTYDEDGDGEVGLEELVQIILGTIASVGALSSDDSAASNQLDEMERRADDVEFAREVATALDVNGDGSIERDEFFQTITNIHLMYECFATALKLPLGGLEVAEALYQSSIDPSIPAPDMPNINGPVFDFGMLRRIRDKYSIDVTKGRGSRDAPTHGGSTGGEDEDMGDFGVDDDGEGGAKPAKDEEAEAAEGEAGKRRTSILDRSVDRHHFRRLLRDVWKCPEDALFLSDRVFDYFDEDGSGSMEVSELYNGITVALRGSIEERAEFFYSLFDTDKKGHMESDEIMRMLIASMGGEDVSDEDAKRVLAKIDEDGSGTVEREEFINAVLEDPSIVDALSRVFGQTGVKLSALLEEEEEDEDEAEAADVLAEQREEEERLRKEEAEAAAAAVAAAAEAAAAEARAKAEAEAAAHTFHHPFAKLSRAASMGHASDSASPPGSPPLGGALGIGSPAALTIAGASPVRSAKVQRARSMHGSIGHGEETAASILSSPAGFLPALTFGGASLPGTALPGLRPATTSAYPGLVTTSYAAGAGGEASMFATTTSGSGLPPLSPRRDVATAPFSPVRAASSLGGSRPPLPPSDAAGMGSPGRLGTALGGVRSPHSAHSGSIQVRPASVMGGDSSSSSHRPGSVLSPGMSARDAVASVRSGSPNGAGGSPLKKPSSGTFSFVDKGGGSQFASIRAASEVAHRRFATMESEIGTQMKKLVSMIHATMPAEQLAQHQARLEASKEDKPSSRSGSRAGSRGKGAMDSAPSLAAQLGIPGLAHTFKFPAGVKYTGPDPLDLNPLARRSKSPPKGKRKRKVRAGIDVSHMLGALPGPAAHAAGAAIPGAVATTTVIIPPDMPPHLVNDYVAEEMARMDASIRAAKEKGVALDVGGGSLISAASLELPAEKAKKAARARSPAAAPPLAESGPFSRAAVFGEMDPTKLTFKAFRGRVSKAELIERVAKKRADEASPPRSLSREGSLVGKEPSATASPPGSPSSTMRLPHRFGSVPAASNGTVGTRFIAQASGGHLIPAGSPLRLDKAAAAATQETRPGSADSEDGPPSSATGSSVRSSRAPTAAATSRRGEAGSSRGSPRRRGTQSFVYGNARGAARWYQKDQSALDMVDTVKEAADLMQLQHYAMTQEVAVLDRGQKTVLSKVAHMETDLKQRHNAEFKAEKEYERKKRATARMRAAQDAAEAAAQEAEYEAELAARASMGSMGSVAGGGSMLSPGQRMTHRAGLGTYDARFVPPPGADELAYVGSVAGIDQSPNNSLMFASTYSAAGGSGNVSGAEDGGVGRRSPSPPPSPGGYGRRTASGIPRSAPHASPLRLPSSGGLPHYAMHYEHLNAALFGGAPDSAGNLGVAILASRMSERQQARLVSRAASSRASGGASLGASRSPSPMGGSIGMGSSPASRLASRASTSIGGKARMGTATTIGSPSRNASRSAGPGLARGSPAAGPAAPGVYTFSIPGGGGSQLL